LLAFKGTEKQVFRKLRVCSTQVKNTKEYGKTLTSANSRLVSYLSDFQGIFKNRTKTFFDKAESYTQGLIVSAERNIEKITDAHPKCEYYSMQHFISDSKWGYKELINLVSSQTSSTLPIRKLTGLIIDETGNLKKGDKSVGVGWQYCGNAGKVANCQVAVMACLSNGDFASLVDARLYLPEAWCNSPERCEEAKIPEGFREFKTKLDIAYEIILDKVKAGLSFDFVGADGYYGNDMDFASKIDDLGLVYMLDAHSDQSIYLKRTELYLPKRVGKRGRPPKKLKADQDCIKLSEYYKNLDKRDWQEIKVRNTAKGVLKAEYHMKRVYIWNKERNCIEPRLLVIRKSKTKRGWEIKYSFTNAEPAQYTPIAIAYMQAQRFFIEHCIKESKSILGMDQFQTRKWLAWYHQIALNIMLMCFMLKEKLLCFFDLPLLSARDIKDWLAFNLIKQFPEQDLLKLILDRHKRRQLDINYSFIKQMCNVSK